MLSGMYVDEFRPIDKYFDKQAQQRVIMKKISSIFYILKNLGICEMFNANTIKVDRGKLSEFTLNDILSYNVGGFRKK